MPGIVGSVCKLFADDRKLYRNIESEADLKELQEDIERLCKLSTVSHFSYAPFFQGPHFLTKMLETNIFYDNLFIGILSVR